MTYYEQVLSLNFMLQDAMSDHEGMKRDTLAAAVADLDLLASGTATRNCWDARPGTGSGTDTFLVYWGSQFAGGTTCGELDTLTAQLLRQIATSIEGFEPSLAEVARSLADQADTAQEQLDVITPDVGDIWRESPDWIKMAGAALLALLLIKAIK
jgi:hypothetical protein